MLHYFNPGHETAVLNASRYYMAPAIQLKMQEDLAYLPAWYASPGDFVLVKNKLPLDFLCSTGSLNPLAVALTEENATRYASALNGMEAALWGISPQSIYFMEQLNERSGISLVIPQWNEEYIRLCSRHAAKECLEYLTGNIPEVSNDIIPRFYTKLEDIEQSINREDVTRLAKAPYSSSGRGLLWLEHPILNKSQKQVLQGILKKQGMVSIEKTLDKKLDFAMEFFLDGKGNIVFEGLSLFNTSAKGSYAGNVLDTQANISARILSYIDASLLESVKQMLTGYLGRYFSMLYRGCIGVDMMIYEDNGQFHIHPCVEINMRYNMGFLAVRLYRNYILSGGKGFFTIEYDSQEGALYQRHKAMQQLHPACFINGRIKSGYLPLCPVNETSWYQAYIVMGESEVNS